MDSIGDALIIDSEIRITSAGNFPAILVSCRHPLTTDYIYIHDKLGMKIFSTMPYTAAAYGLDEGYDPVESSLLMLESDTLGLELGYYDLLYNRYYFFKNDREIPYDGQREYAYAGNLYMFKFRDWDDQMVWDSCKEQIERLSHEITVDGTDDPDYVLQHEYVFLFPQQFPERLLSDFSPAGAHAMKMILKNKKVVADAYTHKVVYSFYPELSYERGQ